MVSDIIRYEMTTALSVKLKLTIRNVLKVAVGYGVECSDTEFL